jgi:dipeptidyl aminopeptidase/acylaminoacyl peptidase
MGSTKNILIILIVTLIGVVTSCTQKHKPLPVAEFFTYADKSNYRISPDGRYISYVETKDQHRQLHFIDLQDKPNAQPTSSPLISDVGNYFWLSSQEIAFTKRGSGDDTLRFLAYSLEKSTLRSLLPSSKMRIGFINPIRVINDSLLIHLNARDSTLFDVYRMHVFTGQKRLIATNPGNIIRWIPDHQGQVRLALASDSVQQTLLYRAQESLSFEPVLRTSFLNYFEPLGFVKQDPQQIFALSNIGRDKRALVRFNLQEGKESSMEYENLEVDAGYGGYHHDRGEIDFAYYEEERPKRHFFNKAIEKLYQDLGKKLEGFEIKIIDQDRSEKHLIFQAFSDANPGGVYYYNLATQHLVKLMDNQPLLSIRTLASMKPITYQASDGLVLHGYLTLPVGAKAKNLPVIVIPHGGPSDRDYWRFNPEVQFFANRGYAVFQVNFRGSSGYGKDFWKAGFKQWGGKIQEDIQDGVRWLIDNQIADPKRIGIYGRGFGGYSALFAASLNNELFACAASYGGYTNLFAHLKEIPLYAKSHLKRSYEIIGNPEVDSDLIKSMSPIFHTETIQIPLFIAQGGNDAREVNHFVQKVRKQNVPITYILRKEEGRYFREDANRLKLYEELIKFFDTHLKK